MLSGGPTRSLLEGQTGTRSAVSATGTDKSKHCDDGSPGNGRLLDVLQRPDTQRIYIHDYSDLDVASFERQLGPVGNLRAERAVVMAQHGDLVLVAAPVDDTYLRYLDRIGLGPGRDRVLTLARGELAGNTSVSLFEMLRRDQPCVARISERLDPERATRLSTFYGGPGTHLTQSFLQETLGCEVEVDAGTSASAVLANEKAVLRSQADAMGVPVAPGEVVSWSRLGSAAAATRLMAAIERHGWTTGGVMIRGAWSGGGLDNLVLRDGVDARDLASWLGERGHLESYLVEALLSFDASPNVQLWIDDDGGAAVLETTNQRLNGEFTHIGNAYPHDSDLRRNIDDSSLRIAEWLSDRGYRGPLGIDFLETQALHGDKRTHVFVEVNGRVNGATYGIATWSRINQCRANLARPPIAAWTTTKKIATQCRDFSELADRLGDLIYTHDHDAGAIPYNVGLLQTGGISFSILAATIADAEHLEDRLVDRIKADR